MRLIALTVVLLACDQGRAPNPAAAPERVPQPVVAVAPAAPPAYVIRDTADFVAKATVAVDELIGIFAQGGKDCDVVATGLRRFSESNRTLLDSMTRYGRAHPEAERAFADKLQHRMTELVKILEPTMVACGAHAGMTAALRDVADAQYLQRPR